MMIFHMTSMAQNNQIRQVIIISIGINMMCIQFFNRIAYSTKIWQFSESITSIREFSCNKVRVLFSNFFQGSNARVIKTFNRAENIFSFPIQCQNFFTTLFALLKFVRISAFIRTTDRAKLSFFCRMMNKFFIAYQTFCDSMMMKIVACARAIEAICSMVSSNRLDLIAKFAGVLHKRTPISLSTI